MYKGLFVACVMYGASAWYECMKNQRERNAINRCQRMVLYACLRVCRTVSTEAMQVLMGELPWDLECVKRGVKFKLKNGVRMTVEDVISEDEVRVNGVDLCMRMVDDRLYDAWQKRWDESSNGRVTYKFISNVRFVSMNEWFQLSTYAGYLLTGHGSMNASLFQRGLSESKRCACGSASEDWMHILVECELYNDLRDLELLGVKMGENGSVDVSGVLECRERFVCLNEYARNVFERRKSRLDGI
jgi:hypothetical protein